MRAQADVVEVSALGCQLLDEVRVDGCQGVPGERACRYPALVRHEDQRSRYETGNATALEGLRAQKELAAQMKIALVRGEVDTIGHLLGEAWREKQKMSERITTPLIDEAMKRALASGALGGKVTGAGGGGHMVFVCEFERRHLVAQELIDLGLTVSEPIFSRDGVTTWRGQN